MFDSEQLIELVKSRPAIYNSTSKVYRCKTAATESWEQIAAIMNKDAQVCRQVWTGLRSSYARHLQNQRKNKEGIRQRHKKAWYLADKLTFLDKHMQLTPNERRLYHKPRGKKRNLVTTVDDSSTSFRSEEITMDGTLSIASIKSEAEEIEIHDETNNSNSMQSPELFEETTNKTENSMKKLETKEEDNKFHSTKSQVELDNEDQNTLTTQWSKKQRVYSSSQNSSKRMKMDPSESNVDDESIKSREDSMLIFFQSMLLDIRKLSDRQLRLFKQDIFEKLNKYLDEEDMHD